MKITQLSSMTGKAITVFESENARIAPLLHDSAHWHVSLLQIGPHGTLGRHKALSDQIMFVFYGSGKLVGAALNEIDVQALCLVLWKNDEDHATRAGEMGLKAMIIEGDNLEKAYHTFQEENSIS